MSNNTASRSAGLSNVLGLVKKYSFVLVFLAIFVVYAIANGGLTLNATMNVLRHSAVIGTIAIGMGIVCLTGEIDLSVDDARARGGLLGRGVQH